MNGRPKVNKTQAQIKNEQLLQILSEIEKDLDALKLTIEIKDEQINKFATILKVTKSEYQNISNENKQLQRRNYKIIE